MNSAQTGFVGSNDQISLSPPVQMEGLEMERVEEDSLLTMKRATVSENGSGPI